MAREPRRVEAADGEVEVNDRRAAARIGLRPADGGERSSITQPEESAGREERRRRRHSWRRGIRTCGRRRKRRSPDSAAHLGKLRTVATTSFCRAGGGEKVLDALLHATRRTRGRSRGGRGVLSGPAGNAVSTAARPAPGQPVEARAVSSRRSGGGAPCPRRGGVEARQHALAIPSGTRVGQDVFRGTCVICGGERIAPRPAVGPCARPRGHRRDMDGAGLKASISRGSRRRQQRQAVSA